MNETNSSEITENKKANFLINEKSPYLLQHAYNPVDWYPWADESFIQAKKENKPILLSIGYSTCHWCHVMGKESFEDLEVAKLMNETFICIKVDREERPDIDNVYMSVCQTITGKGGWPLTIFMTPDKDPFFAATYIPKTSRFGSVGMLDLIPHVRDLWINNQKELINDASEIKNLIKPINNNKLKNQKELNEEILNHAFRQLLSAFDKIEGGFGKAPKFPSAHNLSFLARYWHRTRNYQALNMLTKTLDSMHKGGIYDHIGFGFHRYSTDNKWLVPHFEKMLYDQAMLIMIYTEAYQITGNEKYKQISQEIIAYVLKEMQSKEGAFLSAEDADSEGVEGKFYVWTLKEIYEILSPQDAELFCKIYNVFERGNYHEEISNHITNNNIIHLITSLEEIAQRMNFSLGDLKNQLERCRKLLFEYRHKRVHPLKDDKVLTDWNGLMIVALSKASRVFNEEKYMYAAIKAVSFVKNQMLQNGKLKHRYREKETLIDAFLDDYAFLIWGLIELYQATFDIEYLSDAMRLNTIQIAEFEDEINGGFFHSSKNAEKLLYRNKEIYDGAIPSGNSIAILNLLKLARISGNTTLEEKAYDAMYAFASQITSIPMGYTQILQAFDFALGPTYEVVVVGNKKNYNTKHILSILNTAFIPNMVLILKENEQISEIVPYTKTMQLTDTTTVYVCQDFNCNMPTSEIREILKLLQLDNR